MHVNFIELQLFMGFPYVSVGKESAAMQETWVRSLDWEDPLEKEKGTHSSILALKSQTRLSDFHFKFFTLYSEIVIQEG